MKTIMVRITVPPNPAPLTPSTIIQEEQAVENEHKQPEMAACWGQESSIREIKATEHVRSGGVVSTAKVASRSDRRNQVCPLGLGMRGVSGQPEGCFPCSSPGDAKLQRVDL